MRKKKGRAGVSLKQLAVGAFDGRLFCSLMVWSYHLPLFSVTKQVHCSMIVMVVQLSRENKFLVEQEVNLRDVRTDRTMSFHSTTYCSFDI